MPVSSDHLADDIKELRESQQQMAEAIRDFVRDFGNFRVDMVNRLGTFSTSIRSEMAEKFGAVNANLEASRERTDAALAGVRSEMAEKFGVVNANLEVSRERTDVALSGLRADLEASRQRTETSLTAIRVEVSEKFGGIHTNLESFRGRVEVALRIASWTVGILIPLVFSLIGFGFWFTWHAAKLDSAVEGLNARMNPAPAAAPMTKGR